MLGYLLRRLLQSLLLLVVVSLLCFLLAELAPGSFFDQMRLDPRISPETVAALKARHGLDKPWPVRYVQWLRSVGRGELGYSFLHQVPAGSLLKVRARNTLLLTVTATVWAWLLALPLGLWSGCRHGGWLDHGSCAVAALLLAIPEVVLALAAIVVAVTSGAFPAGGMVSVDFDQLDWLGQVWDLVAHLVLPASVLAAGALPVLFFHVRASVAEAREAFFMRAARAHGIGGHRLVTRYLMRAAANPLVSLLGLSTAGLLSGSILVEVVMGWPGLGPLMVEAVLARDLHVVVGIVLVSGVFLIGGNLMADMLLCLLDPRIRTEVAR
jgi:peptide/nickel transport system permease protein